MARMVRLQPKTSTSQQLSARFRQLIILTLTVIIGILISVSVNAQAQKQKSQLNKSTYKAQANAKDCPTFEKKRSHHIKSQTRSSKVHKINLEKSAGRNQNVTANVTTHEQPNIKKSVHFAEETYQNAFLDSANPLRQQTDGVLTMSHLPIPTSRQHTMIREMVAQKLQDKKDIGPIELAPLYFTFNEDKLTVDDMNPFLIAVEFALQGRSISIEGHTDGKSKNDYNTHLSLMQVQKIRELMNTMGVPDERIFISGYDLVAQLNYPQEGQVMLNRRVDFKAF